MDQSITRMMTGWTTRPSTPALPCFSPSTGNPFSPILMKQFLLPLVMACSMGGTAGAAVVDVVRNSSRSNGDKLKPGASVAEGASLATGPKSRLQLRVGRHGGVVRTGSATDAVLASE